MERHRSRPDASWRRYPPNRGLYLFHTPAKVSAFCNLGTHLPSRDGRWWRPVETDGHHKPLRVSSCPSCHRLQKADDGVRAVPAAVTDHDPVMEHGLSGRPRRCPKCEGLLEQEPGYSRCRWGCGKLWPIRGASLARQFEYELRSGLRLIA